MSHHTAGVKYRSNPNPHLQVKIWVQAILNASTQHTVLFIAQFYLLMLIVTFLWKWALYNVLCGATVCGLTVLGATTCGVWLYKCSGIILNTSMSLTVMSFISTGSVSSSNSKRSSSTIWVFGMSGDGWTLAGLYLTREVCLTVLLLGSAVVVPGSVWATKAVVVPGSVWATKGWESLDSRSW